MSDAPSSTRQPGPEAAPTAPNGRLSTRTIVTLVGAALTIGLILVFGIPEILARLQKRQVRELISKAKTQIVNDDRVGAMRTLGEAYKIDPRNPDTLRLTARSLEQLPGGTEQAAYIWRQLIETHAGTTADTAAYAMILLRVGSRDEARNILENIPSTEQDGRPALELKAAFARADGQNEASERLLRAAYLADIANPEAQLRLAMLDLDSPFLEVQENANGRLWQLAQAGGPEAINAMRILAEQPRLSASRAAAMRKMLDSFPDASDERRLPIVSGILRALPAEREGIISVEAARQQGRPFEKTATFIRWLASNNEHERLLSLLPSDQAVRHSDLFLPYVAAMEQTHRWKELREMVRKNPSLPVSPATTALILARCAQSLREPSEVVRGHLQDGIKRAWIVKDRSTMMSIGNTADEFGQPDVAIEAFNLLSSQPQSKLPMLERMLQIHQRQRNLPAMIEIIERCLDEQPANPGYIEAWCYLKLLEGSEMEKAADIIRRHLETNPGRVSTGALIQAFAAYRFGDLESADREAKSVAVSKLPPGQRAVLAGILHACGHEADAFQVAEKVPDSIVLLEESRLLKTAL